MFLSLWEILVASCQVLPVQIVESPADSERYMAYLIVV